MRYDKAIRYSLLSGQIDADLEAMQQASKEDIVVQRSVMENIYRHAIDGHRIAIGEVEGRQDIMEKLG